jgi:hypothetical protein
LTEGYKRASKNKFKKGEVVFAKVAPTIKLVVRRYVDRIYYCIVQDINVHKELVYFERELMGGLEKTV